MRAALHETIARHHTFSCGVARNAQARERKHLEPTHTALYIHTTAAPARLVVRAPSVATAGYLRDKPCAATEASVCSNSRTTNHVQQPRLRFAQTRARRNQSINVFSHLIIVEALLCRVVARRFIQQIWVRDDALGGKLRQRRFPHWC